MYIDVGQKFSNWTTLEGGEISSREKVSVKCDCGLEKSVRLSRVVHSDGCKHRHGMSGTPEYKSWIAMRRRCRSDNDSAYQNYGGRGIDYVDRWDSFENFYADMGPRPAGTSIDRIDNDGPYAPWNCRWATPQEQSANTRQAILITAWGETKTITQWSLDERCAVSNPMLAIRLRNGWNPEEAISIKLKDSGPR